MRTESSSSGPSGPSVSAPASPAPGVLGLSQTGRAGGNAPRHDPSPADRAEPGRLHELHAATPADAPAAAAAALLMAHAGCPDRPVAWLRLQAAERSTGILHGPGLAELGFPPDRLLLAVLPDDLALLKAGTDLLKSRALGAVLLELHGPCRRLDLTTSRRLALAAAAGNCLALLLRVAAEPAPSSAWHRWQVAAAPSRPLAARAPGAPAFTFELLRNRAGPAGATHALEWAQGRLAPHTPDTPETADAPAPSPALPRAALSLPAGRSLPPGRRAA
jgi:protein ImuA